jgi:hypothetical protein
MELISMERTAKEKADAEKRWKDGPVATSGPDFPWGLSLSLGKDELAKLGIKDLPEVGAEYTILAIGKVTRVNQSASAQQTEDTMSVEIQLTDLACEPGTSAADEEEDGDGRSPAEKVYGKRDAG